MAYTNINKCTDFFNTALYTGNGSTQSITGVGHQSDFLWIKAINDTRNYQLQDSVRNSFDNIINCDAEGGQGTFTDGVTAVGSDGFDVGARAALNTNNDNLVAWSWKGGTTSGITTNGSTTITPSAYSFNQTSGFSCVQYTGNLTAGAKVAHGLGQKPDLIIIKRLDSDTTWIVYTSTLGATKYLNLNETDTVQTNTNRFNDTEPDDVNFSLGTTTYVNANGSEHVAYCFAAKAGYSRMLTWSGGAEPRFLYCGFKPKFFFGKSYNGTGESWILYDDKR